MEKAGALFLLGFASIAFPCVLPLVPGYLSAVSAVEAQRLTGINVVDEASAVAEWLAGELARPGAKGEVRSILVVAKKPIELARRIALDRCSRSSAALVRLLCAGRWGIRPEFIEMEPDPAAMLSAADAALVIGDPALRVALKWETLAGKSPSGEACCKGDPSDQPVPGVDTLFLYDVAHQWREMTGRPCVLALWVGRCEAITPEVVADFLASKEYGMARFGEIAEGAALKLDLPARALERYLRENIDFSLDAENREGLDMYFRQCAEAGLIPRFRPLELAAAPGHASVESRDATRVRAAT